MFYLPIMVRVICRSLNVILIAISNAVILTIYTIHLLASHVLFPVLRGSGVARPAELVLLFHVFAIKKSYFGNAWSCSAGQARPLATPLLRGTCVIDVLAFLKHQCTVL